MKNRTEHRLRRLLEAGRSLTPELDLDEVLDRILVVARELTGAGYAAIGVLDEQRRELAEFLTSGISPEIHAEIGALPRGRGLLGVLIAEPQPFRLHDVAEDPRSYGFPPGHPPMRSFLGVPIRIRGEAWGNVHLTEKAGGADFDDDLRDVVALAGWAAIAIRFRRGPAQGTWEGRGLRRIAATSVPPRSSRPQQPRPKLRTATCLVGN